MSTRYVVKDEHTLGYLIPDTNLMGVLHGSVLRGGHGWINGPVSTSGSVIRPATAEDFREYRVMLPPDFLATGDADDTICDACCNPANGRCMDDCTSEVIGAEDCRGVTVRVAA